MSCNGCRVLRKGCSEACVLRQCLRLIDTPEAQGHATLFVAKFFGRAGLMSSISAVPDSQRPALFQSLLFEACGRTINPVNGAVGLLWTGNWHLCQAAVETVLRGGTLRPIPTDEDSDALEAYDVGACPCARSAHKGASSQQLLLQQAPLKRRMASSPPAHEGTCEGVPPAPSPLDPTTLELCLTSVAPSDRRRPRRSGTPSEESVTTTCAESGLRAGAATVSHQREHLDPQQQQQPMLLNLFI